MVPPNTILHLARPWSAMIYLATDCHWLAWIKCFWPQCSKAMWDWLDGNLYEHRTAVLKNEANLPDDCIHDKLMMIIDKQQRRINQWWWRLCPESCLLPSERLRSRSLEAAPQVPLTAGASWVAAERGLRPPALQPLNSKASQRRALTNLILFQSTICPLQGLKKVYTHHIILVGQQWFAVHM